MGLLVRHQRPVGLSTRRLAANLVFQNTSLPVKNAMFTPALTAAVTFARCCPDQYSSWPAETKTLCCSIIDAAPGWDMSMPLV